MIKGFEKNEKSMHILGIHFFGLELVIFASYQERGNRLKHTHEEKKRTKQTKTEQKLKESKVGECEALCKCFHCNDNPTQRESDDTQKIGKRHSINYT